MEPDTSMEEGSDELRKALEWELSLDNNDLRSRAWYHGTIPRARAEELLTDNGDFLIRDCISRPGDYVLTCKWRNSPLHFVINKVIQQPNTVYEKIQFQFEDDCFDTVPGMVTYYVGSKNTISVASGAIVSKPINRSMPLSYYASRYGAAKQDLASYSAVGMALSECSINGPPALPSKQLEPSGDRPPPKPSRVCRANNEKNHTQIPDHLYHEPVFEAQRTLADSRFSFLAEQTSCEEGDIEEVVEPEKIAICAFDLKEYSTVLLPVENKPLEATSLLKARSLIMSAGPKMLASHLTSVDLDLLKIKQDSDLGLGVRSGLELMLLPQGLQLCHDLLERTNCLKYFVATLILTCGSEAERAQMLHKWIQVGADTKAALGNLYGFTGLMMGMSLPQVSRLRSTWLTLRRLHTESALTFETKLRPTLKAMQECSNPQAPNTSIPYLFSLATILHRDPDAELPPGIPHLGLQWEQTCADYGLMLLLSHLENGRKNANECNFYRRNSEIVLEDAKYDEQLKDVFRTEFQLRFLWGSRGATVVPKERYSKFEQVLDVMSERCEPSDISST